MTKRKTSERIKSFILNNPRWTVAEIADKFNVSRPYIYALRKKAKAAQEEAPAIGTWALDSDAGSGTIVATHTPAPAAEAPVAVDAVLDQRAVEYGTFKDGAELMQSLKRRLAAHAQKHGSLFADDQWEALEMIVHKIARIVNGNPDNVDSWRDIAGYAVLVADRLEGRAR